MLASESPALDVIGATFVRELEPGEMVVIDGKEVRSERPFPAERLDPKLCIFEFVYFARPDTRLYGNEVHGARRRMGELLADQAPVEADLVMGVPDSGVPAAEGYAVESGIPYGQGLVKNRYIGRTFIAPTQAERANGVRRKLNPLRENIAGKRLVVVDDSIVRGTTTRAMVKMLREAGAAEVHLRISSPPFRWPCFYGIDTPDRAELLAAIKTDRRDRRVPRRRLARLPDPRPPGPAIDAPGAGFCDACLTGEYPVPVPVAVRRARLADRCGRHLALRRGRLPGVTGSAPARPCDRPTRLATDSDRRGPAPGHLRRCRGRHRRRRAGRRADQAPGASTPRPEVLGGLGGFGGLFAVDRDGTASRSWWPAPTASAPRRWWPRPWAASTPSGSTWWPCAWTTWCARGPSRCSSSTTCPRVGRPGPDGRAHGRGGRGVPPGRVRPPRRRDGRAPRGDEAGRVRPGRLRRRGRRAGGDPRPVPGPRRDVLVGLASPGLRCNGYSLARHVLLERAGRSLDEPAWPGAPSRWATSCCGRR